MNTSIRLKFALLTTCAALPTAGLFAQAPAAPDSTPSVSVPATTATTPATGTTGGHEKHDGKMREKLASLTPAERQELKTAHEKALQDPAVKAAEATKETDKKGFRKTLREAMLRADPAVAPILEKLREEGGGGKKKNL